jgi:hypothetical protein
VFLKTKGFKHTAREARKAMFYWVLGGDFGRGFQTARKRPKMAVNRRNQFDGVIGGMFPSFSRFKSVVPKGDSGGALQTNMEG